MTPDQYREHIKLVVDEVVRAMASSIPSTNFAHLYDPPASRPHLPKVAGIDGCFDLESILLQAFDRVDEKLKAG